jgi:hypothetical protein
LAAGWSRRLGRLVAYQFLAADEYAIPRPVCAVSVPYVSEVESLDPTEPADLVGLAQAQFQKIPEAVGGTLMVAEIRPRSITLHNVFDFGTCRMLQPSLAEARG